MLFRFRRTLSSWTVALVLSLGLCLSASPGEAQIPLFSEITGHSFGQRITQHHEMVRFLETLAEQSDRVRLIRQGSSWEGREFLAAVVTSPENQDRLDRIQEVAQKLADPRGLRPTEAGDMMEDHPIVIWMGGSIHGNELSGSEGLLKLLERLATAQDPATVEALASSVVIIDPMLNPDGRDAYAVASHRVVGTTPNPELDDWSHDATRWEAIGYRTGHYFFDTNRDWFAHTQRETQARLPTLLAWRPQVVVDAHEMGSDAEFYFDPAAEPYGPHFPPYARQGLALFGRAYAQAFDQAGFEYMTRERFNFFYPGYTTSFGSYQGGIGMLYEQGSTRGLAIARPDGSVRRLADAIEQQYTTAWTAVKTAVGNRAKLLRGYYEAAQAAVNGGGQGETVRFLIPPSGDRTLVTELVQTLTRNGIEVGLTTSESRFSRLSDHHGREVADRTLPSGTYVVEVAQPKAPLVRTLLEPHQPVSEAFLREARERVERGENPRFYDMTAWSLPLLFGVEVFSTTESRSVTTLGLADRPPVLMAPPQRAGYAYLLDGSDASVYSALYFLKTEGHRASVLFEESQLGGEAVAEGTVVVRVGQNDDSVHDAVSRLIARFGVRVRSVDSGLGDVEPEVSGAKEASGTQNERSFPSLGSGSTRAIGQPEIALLAEGPVDGYSFGWAWYTLDHQYQIPTTVLRSAHLHRTPLDRFDVLVIPDLTSASAMERTLREAGLDRIQRWVRDGGTLVVIGEGVELARSGLDLIALRSWYPESDESQSEAEADEEPQRFTVPGAFLRAEVDTESWLTTGYDQEMAALVFSSRIFLPPTGPPSPARRVAIRYTSEGSLVVAGHAWPESLERLTGAVFAYHEQVGRGQVVAFAEDVNFRGYYRGGDRLFLNAVLLGPSW